ncbi:unnamed protein product, partial [Musa acuminata var. zebrina]
WRWQRRWWCSCWPPALGGRRVRFTRWGMPWGGPSWGAQTKRRGPCPRTSKWETPLCSITARTSITCLRGWTSKSPSHHHLLPLPPPPPPLLTLLPVSAAAAEASPRRQLPLGLAVAQGVLPRCFVIGLAVFSFAAASVCGSSGRSTATPPVEVAVMVPATEGSGMVRRRADAPLRRRRPRRSRLRCRRRRRMAPQPPHGVAAGNQGMTHASLPVAVHEKEKERE